jgi:ABC-type Na+ efflux pump permease subunit
MFAIVLEREPTKLEALPATLTAWTLAAGAFAAAALLIYFIAYLVRPPKVAGAEPAPPLWRTLLAVVLFGGLLAFVPAGLVRLAPRLGLTGVTELLTPPTPAQKAGWYALVFVAACAAVAVLVPVFRNLSRLRLRRIWALAKLSFKEAVRRRVLWAFAALILVVLFASWFLDYKPEDQVRNYVRVTYWAMAPLLLLAAGLLASFSIPDDLKRQTMHTIITKPVERFEIVLGRCLGYVMLMSLVLFGLTAAGLVYVARGVVP